ncbi:MAG: zf-TFIIB domain-containing protein [Deltaproteobacteria bacterium]|nr:zf-TFIIB domain-containing protein [Deltaproteobacteria bacterium]
MHCPRCGTSELVERDRDGIVVDVCTTCRGIWLDRGELEKLIARATSELDAHESRHQEVRHEERRRDDTPPRVHRRDSTPPRGHRHDEHDRRHRKRGWLESLGDIFD